MKYGLFLALVTPLLLPAPCALAQNEPPDPGFKASALRDACNPPASADATTKDAADRVCQAYLRGVADGLFMLGTLQRSGAPICLPDDGPVSPAEAKSEFQDYLQEHPDAANRSAGVAAAFAIITAHPCE